MTLNITENITNNITKKAIQSESAESKTMRASKEWESYFIGMMLKEMRKTIHATNLDGESSFAKDTYYEMFDNQVARNIAENGGFGLAKNMMKSLAQQQRITLNQELINKFYEQGNKTDINTRLPSIGGE